MLMSFPRAASLQVRANSDKYIPDPKRETVVKTASMHVLVHRTAQNNLVVVRGSDSVSDWVKVNANMGMEDAPSLAGRLHKGFKWAAFSLIPDLMPAINLDLPTTFIGHSMGGAVAQILAAIFVKNHYEVTEVITFGQPKVGDKKFVEWYDDQSIITHRIVNQRDMVTTLPSRFGSYKHTKQVVYLSNGVKWKVPWYRSLRCFVSLLPKLIQIKSTDHSMAAYQQSVEREFAWQRKA